MIRKKQVNVVQKSSTVREERSPRHGAKSLFSPEEIARFEAAEQGNTLIVPSNPGPRRHVSQAPEQALKQAATPAPEKGAPKRSTHRHLGTISVVVLGLFAGSLLFSETGSRAHELQASPEAQVATAGVVAKRSKRESALIHIGRNKAGPTLYPQPKITWFERTFCTGTKISQFCPRRMLHPFIEAAHNWHIPVGPAPEKHEAKSTFAIRGMSSSLEELD